MESICRAPSLLSSSSSFLAKPFRTLTLAPPKTTISIRASKKPNPNPAETLISTVVKPAIIVLTAASAVFLSRHPKPSLANPPPAAVQSETLADEQATNPNEVSSLRSLMELKVKNKDLAGAISIADKLIALEPTEKDLPILKAHLQSYNGEVKAAKLGFEEVLSRDPFLVEAYHGLVLMASQSGNDGELDEILRRVEGTMEMCKEEKRIVELKDFKLLVAQVRIIEGRYAEALQIYQELVKEDPRDFRPYLCQGIIYTLLRKKDEAERQFEKYRRLVPKGHPYAEYLDHNMNLMKGFSPQEQSMKSFGESEI